MDFNRRSIKTANDFIRVIAQKELHTGENAFIGFAFSSVWRRNADGVDAALAATRR